MNLAAGCGTGLRGGADMKLIESFSTTALQLARIFVAWAPGSWLRAHGPGTHATFGCGFAAPGVDPTPEVAESLITVVVHEQTAS